MAGTDAIVEALRGVADPCCAERGISVVDMGLLESVDLEDGRARVDVLLTSGWCPFQPELVEAITRAVQAVPGVEHAVVRVLLDGVWTAERMAPGARAKLRFLPDPAEVADPRAYAAARRLPVAPAAAAPRRGARS